MQINEKDSHLLNELHYISGTESVHRIRALFLLSQQEGDEFRSMLVDLKI